jgi:hypothetical protein
VILRCTAKAFDLLGGRRLELTESTPTDDDWYLNLLWVDRKKCLLLTHAGTLFSVFVAGVRKADLVPVGHYIVNAVTAELRAEGLPTDALGRLDPGGVSLARTASRRTLGFMNDIATHCRFEIACAGGLVHADTRALNHHLRRTLNNHGGYAYPIERVAERLDADPQNTARARRGSGNRGED